MEIPASVLAVGRAGAGTNNIPVSLLSQRGVPVFNSPGANANAVKELVLAGLFLGARHIGPALDFVRSLDLTGDALEAAVEQGKKRFVGHELPGRTLGVVGLGAIGVEVANAAHLLGMHVLGYDPQITVQRAWQLSSGVEQALSLDDLFTRSHAVTVHVPLIDATRGLVSAKRIALMPEGAPCSTSRARRSSTRRRSSHALRAGQARRLRLRFPVGGDPRRARRRRLAAPRRIDQRGGGELRDDGRRHAAGFPRARQHPPFGEFPGSGAAAHSRDGAHRRSRTATCPNMVGQISTRLAEAGLNIADLLNKSKGELAYTLIDIDGKVPAGLVERIASIQGVLSARAV